MAGRHCIPVPPPHRFRSQQTLSVTQAACGAPVAPRRKVSGCHTNGGDSGTAVCMPHLDVSGPWAMRRLCGAAPPPESPLKWRNAILSTHFLAAPNLTVLRLPSPQAARRFSESTAEPGRTKRAPVRVRWQTRLTVSRVAMQGSEIGFRPPPGCGAAATCRALGAGRPPACVVGAYLHPHHVHVHVNLQARRWKAAP